jgi:hypothetical protein
LVAGGNITLAGGGNPVFGNGISSFQDLGDRYTDGGELDALSQPAPSSSTATSRSPARMAARVGSSICKAPSTSTSRRWSI